jgi:molybdopterin-binding protein
MRISARNRLKGTIKSIERGPIHSKVRIDIGGGQTLTAAICTESVDDLGLAVGGDCDATIKATSVMVAADH